MDMYGLAQLLQGGIAVHEGGDLLHHVGGMGAEDMTGEDRVGVGIGDELHHTFGLTDGQCLAAGLVVTSVYGDGASGSLVVPR